MCPAVDPVLWWLKDRPYDTPEDIARGLGAEVPDIVTLCDELEAAGFIALSPSGRP